MTKKYKLLKEFKEVNGVKLFRVQATKSFGTIKKGEKGGFIEKEANLSHDGNAWVSGNAVVSGNARVYGNALVSGDARVSGRFDLTVSCDFDLPRITIDSKEKLQKLKDFLERF